MILRPALFCHMILLLSTPSLFDHSKLANTRRGYFSLLRVLSHTSDYPFGYTPARASLHTVYSWYGACWLSSNNRLCVSLWPS